MHISIAVGTLLLGGWVLNTPVDEDTTAVLSQPSAAAAATRSSQSSLPVTPYGSQMRRTTGTTGTTDRTRERSMPQRDGGRARPGSTSGSQREGAAGQTTMAMPFAPTEGPTSDTGGMLGQPMAPTESGPSTGASAAGAGAGGAAYPMAPTMGRRSAPRSGQTSRMPAGQGRQTQRFGGGSGMMGAPVDSKPFTGYRPTSGVSPYMNLFRRDSMGTVDNYTSLVQPQVEQRFLNQRFGRDIGGLERNARTQGINLQRLNQEERTLQGVATPQFFMNSRGRFPGYGQ